MIRFILCIAALSLGGCSQTANTTQSQTDIDSCEAAGLPCPKDQLTPEPHIMNEKDAQDMDREAEQILDITYQFDNADEYIIATLFNTKNKQSINLNQVITYSNPSVTVEKGSTFVYLTQTSMGIARFYRVRFTDRVTAELCEANSTIIQEKMRLDEKNEGQSIYVENYLREEIFGHPVKFKCQVFDHEKNYDPSDLQFDKIKNKPIM